MFGGTEEMSFADQFYAFVGQIHLALERIQNLPVFRLVVVSATKPYWALSTSNITFDIAID